MHTEINLKHFFLFRVLYFTNTYHNGWSIEKIDNFDSGEATSTKLPIVLEDIPTAIVVSQKHQRIFWLEGEAQNRVHIRSANFDGTDVKTVFLKNNHIPVNLIVDGGQVYWTEYRSQSVWGANIEGTADAKIVATFNGTIPRGIINRRSLTEQQKNTPACLKVVQQIMIDGPLKTSQKPRTTTVVTEEPITTTETQCNCAAPQTEPDVCHNFCLNDGFCTVMPGGVPKCECNEYFVGNRCSLPRKETVCRVAEVDADSFSRYEINLETLCGVPTGTVFTAETTVRGSPLNGDREFECASSGLNVIVLIVTSGIVLSLVILYGIVMSVRRMYKPLRPKVKKMYVVRKNNLTPLTSRPSTEQQCEITIENCCNMNICDTPCFDPKLLQGDVESEVSQKNGRFTKGAKNGNAILVNYKQTKKDDKKQLLGDIDCNGDLY